MELAVVEFDKCQNHTWWYQGVWVKTKGESLFKKKEHTSEKILTSGGGNSGYAGGGPSSGVEVIVEQEDFKRYECDKCLKVKYEQI